MRVILLLSIVLITLISCIGGKVSENKKFTKRAKDIHKSRWENLSKKKIYFGHQSIGFNIVDGIKDVITNNPQIKLNILESHNPSEFDKPIFAHSRVGENHDPISKNNAFEQFIRKGIGESADFVFFKYCYVDIKSETDVEKLFSEYRDTLAKLKKEYPETTFIHVTVPLVAVQKGPRVWVKKLIGREIGGYRDNIKRNQYNDILRNYYQGKDPVFDLGHIESTFHDGTEETFKEDGKVYHALVPKYTSDGRHLNEYGRRIVAEQLLVFLANLSDSAD